MKNKKISIISLAVLAISAILNVACDLDFALYNPPRDNNFDLGSDEYSYINVEYNIETSQVNVPVNSDIIIYFDKKMNPDNDWTVSFAMTTLGVETLKTYDKASPEISWNANYTALTINPSENFTRSANVDVRLDNFISMSGYANSIRTGDSTSFTTVEYDPCDVTLNIDIDQTNVPIDSNLVMTFDRPMNPDFIWYVDLSINVPSLGQTTSKTFNKNSPEISWNNDYTVLTVNPAEDFPKSANISATLYKFVSLDGNFLLRYSGMISAASIYNSFFFSTEDIK